ncbi:porin family protein [Marinobacter daepoensis]|uniref:Outer membrane beta-barrel protein n=2 Tax=Marinobacter daepoensis TaxID=262077 RepID=A0ABS3BBT6_9GAMM|nr:outer membrane beta-barrel protein [Marinobacter daepoensis]MBN7769320.1 outer membrane beta-barrel protein [Marinobacter daepoensis]MBY6032019.1 porin family protein [Marinobacter daepoensis]MBY6078010.1 porin family protein [Marinobacter daepoensis]
MNNIHPRVLSLTLATLSVFAPAIVAQETPRADKHYVGLLATAIEHRSIGSSDEDGWGQAGTVIIGGHLSELIHAEIRLGGGFADAEISRGDLTLSVDYFGSWYMGLHYPVGTLGNIYAQAGFSHVSGDAHLSNREADANTQFRKLEGDYPGSSFSFSWLAGLDLELMENTYLVFEGGKLFEDTDSGANAFQFSSGLRYEF